MEHRHDLWHYRGMGVAPWHLPHDDNEVKLDLPRQRGVTRLPCRVRMQITA